MPSLLLVAAKGSCCELAIAVDKVNTTSPSACPIWLLYMQRQPLPRRLDEYSKALEALAAAAQRASIMYDEVRTYI